MHQKYISKFLTISVGCSVVMGSAIAINSPAQAQSTCIPLRVVEGQGATVARKRISSPGAGPGLNNNWNTDFAVPTGRQFTSYIATVTAENTAPYNVAVNLKYNDNTASQVFKRDGLNLQRNAPYQITARTSGTRQPYQVNLTISGTFGNTYQARVVACQSN